MSSQATLEQARSAKESANKLFAGHDEVVGVGICKVGDGYGVKINVKQQPQASLPSQVDGVPVVVHEIGTIKKQ